MNKHRLIILQNNDFFFDDIVNEFDSYGCNIMLFPFPPQSDLEQEAYIGELENVCSTFSPDFIFSIDYYPLIALFCNIADLEYKSWIINPANSKLYDESILLPQNHIYLNDFKVISSLKRLGCSHVTHLPFGCPKHIIKNNPSENGNENTICVWGNYYHEGYAEYNPLRSYSTLKDSTKGYIEGSIACKHQIAGADFTNMAMPQYVWDDIMNSSHYKSFRNTLDPKLAYSIDYLNPLVTFEARRRYIYHLLTQNRYQKVLHVNYGDVPFDNDKYYKVDQAISVDSLIRLANSSDINVIISDNNQRSDFSPLEWYLMGSGAFILFSQRENHSIDYDISINSFSNYYELLSKAAYYSAHKSERTELVVSLQKEIRNQHLLCDKIQHILK